MRSAGALGAAALLLGGCQGKECSSDASCAPPPSGVVPTAVRWERTADAPAPARQEVAAVTIGDRVWVVGGLIGEGATNRVDIYFVTQNIWSAAAPLPVKLHHSMAAQLHGKPMVMGGFLESGAASDRVFVMEPSGLWRETAPLRRARGAGAAVAVGDKIVVVGGISGGRHVGPVEIFDGKSWRDGAEIPSLRDHLGVATDGKVVYAVGGRRAGGHFGTFEVYDPAADRWTDLPDMPTARSGMGAAFVDGNVVTVGGEGPRIFPEVEAYDIAKRRWTRLPDLAVPVHGVGVVAVGSNIYAFVGGTRVGLGPTRACQVLAIA